MKLTTCFSKPAQERFLSDPTEQIAAGVIMPLVADLNLQKRCVHT